MNWYTYNEGGGSVGTCSVCFQPSAQKWCSTKCYMADEYPGYKEYRYTCKNLDCRRNFTVWAPDLEEGKECFDCGTDMGVSEV